MPSHKFFKPIGALVLFGALLSGIYFYHNQQSSSDELNLFEPEESAKSEMQASVFNPLSAPNQKYDYHTNSQTNAEIRAEYTDCISKARRKFQPEKYDLSEIFCEQDSSDFVTYLEKNKSDLASEIVTWWRSVALTEDSSYYEIYSCFNGRPSTENAYQSLNVCLSANGSSKYLSNLIYFVGGYIRRNINENLRYSFANNELDYEYLGGTPGTHGFFPYDAEDAYFWYCYLKEEPVYFDVLFNNVYFKEGVSNLDNLRCAASEQYIYMASSKNGPTYCCDESQDVISASTPSNSNLTSVCVSAGNSIRGTCFDGWYEPNENYEYCGNGTCETSDPRGENQCNCPEDCPDPNAIFMPNRELTVSEDAGLIDITVTRRSNSGVGIVGYLLSTDSEANPASSADYENLSKGTLRFEDGETSATIQLKIIDDNQKESDETLRITLSNPQNLTENPTRTQELVLGEPHELQLTIIDND